MQVTVVFPSARDFGRMESIEWRTAAAALTSHQLQELWARNQYAVWAVAKVSRTKVCGHILYQIRHHHSRILHLLVDERHQGHGIGSQLVDFANQIVPCSVLIPDTDYDLAGFFSAIGFRSLAHVTWKDQLLFTRERQAEKCSYLVEP